MTEQLYVIKWHLKENPSVKGQGTPVSKEEAIHGAAAANEQRPDAVHTVEPVRK